MHCLHFASLILFIATRHSSLLQLACRYRHSTELCIMCHVSAHSTALQARSMLLLVCQATMLKPTQPTHITKPELLQHASTHLKPDHGLLLSKIEHLQRMLTPPCFAGHDALVHLPESGGHLAGWVPTANRLPSLKPLTNSSADPRVQHGLRQILQLDEQLMRKSVEATMVARETFPDTWLAADRKQAERDQRLLLASLER